jgi:hypothetical protein
MPQYSSEDGSEESKHYWRFIKERMLEVQTKYPDMWLKLLERQKDIETRCKITVPKPPPE